MERKPSYDELEKRIFDTAATHAAEARDVAPGLAGAE